MLQAALSTTINMSTPIHQIKHETQVYVTGFTGFLVCGILPDLIMSVAHVMRSNRG